MIRRPVILILVVMLAGFGLASCQRSSPPSPEAQAEAARPTPAPVAGSPWYDDVTTAAGINFQHYDSATPMYYIPETVGSGLGWIDFDADGWPDLFCVQSCPIVPAQRTGNLPTHKLYRNNRNGTFTDVTEQVGLNKSGYGMGVAVGDYDNDGFDDLFVTYLGSVSLYANRPNPAGGRRFEDVTAAAKIVNTKWGTSAAWGDLDNDGKLDLYICNYSDIDLDHYKTCTNPNVNQIDICPPNVFPTTPHKLYRNNGDGTFTDVSDSSGVTGSAGGYGFAVGIVDLDGDGKVDLYVANDMKPAYVFQNQGGMKFKEKGLLSGAGLMSGGRFMAGMGVGLGDVDGSGRPSILVSNYQDEPDMLFLNRGKLFFTDWSHPSGIGPATMKTLGFGIDFFDADRDGNLDAAVANGHVIKNAPAFAKAPYEQSAQIFVGDGKAHFREVSDTAGSYFQEKRVGRGLAVGDFDNDGLEDLGYSHIGGPVKLLRNQTKTPNHYVRLNLQGDGKTTNRNAIGAKVELTAGGRTFTRWIHGGGSFLSARDRRLTIGLGSATRAEKIVVTWPNGSRQEFANLDADKGYRLTQGEATTRPDPPAP